MYLWMQWWSVVEQLRPACSRFRTFLWMSACLAAMTARSDLMGVTSLVRALGLKEACYERMLALFHSTALDLDELTRLWVVVIQKIQPGTLKINGRMVIVGDGIKVAKSGKKMPAVKRLHQESEANTKPSYIMGHSCQAVAMLAGALGTIFAVPLAARIHEGVKFNNRDKRTLLDKMVLLIDSLGLTAPFYFVADAYYATGKIVRGLLKNGSHLVSRVKKNAVAYEQPPKIEGAKPRGRPRKYGKRIKLRSMFDEPESMQQIPSPVYGETKVTLQVCSRDLLWRPVGRASGNQHLHKKSQAYRDAVRRKIGAYHCHIQIGIIAQGLLQYLSSAFPQKVWSAFGSWLRTIRPGLCPSESVTAIAMRNALPAFLADSPENTAFTKFLRERIDQDRAEGLRLLDLAA